jgi:[ribosomal protein S18]-alanine N-acetyltransferase
MYRIKEITEQYANEIVGWKYEEPFSVYNLLEDEESIKELLENNYYVVLNEKDDLIGFYCFGEAAQVPYGHQSHVYDEGGYVDLGLGLNPYLTSKGFGKEFVQIGINYCFELYQTDKVRLTVFDFNLRAIKVYDHVGFQAIKQFKSKYKEHYFIVMTLN